MLSHSARSALMLLLFSQILTVVCAMRRQGGRDFAALKKFVESTLL